MYLGRHTRTTRAKDDATIFASAPSITPQPQRPKRKLRAQEKPAKVATHATEVSKLAVSVTTDSGVTPQQVAPSAEVERLQSALSVQRGRIRKLLALLRNKNKTIARQEREIAALTASDRLTVEDVLAEAKTSV